MKNYFRQILTSFTKNHYSETIRQNFYGWLTDKEHAVEKDKAGLAGDRVADQRRFGVVDELVGADIAVNIAGGFQPSAFLNMQVYIGSQANGVAVKHIAALQHHPAAAVFGAVVNGVLNGKGVVGGAVADGTVLENIVFLQLFCSL